jgi:serpin B
MPYVGGALSMVILLPLKATGLGDLEKKLSAEGLDAFTQALSPAQLEIAIPRFTLERAVELSDTLSAMGMPSAFRAGADLSGMTGKADLFISAVVHKAFVDVNEEGTEAAAATAVITSRKNGHPTPRVFKADHPFVFAIRDVATGAILFLGRVTDPKG